MLGKFSLKNPTLSDKKISNSYYLLIIWAINFLRIYVNSPLQRERSISPKWERSMPHLEDHMPTWKTRTTEDDRIKVQPQMISTDSNVNSQDNYTGSKTKICFIKY